MNALRQIPEWVDWLLIISGMAGIWIPAVQTMSAKNAYRDDGIDTLGGALRRWADRRVEANRAEAREIAHRADMQHEQFMSGDSAGVFGDYPPDKT